MGWFSPHYRPIYFKSSKPGMWGNYMLFGIWSTITVFQCINYVAKLKVIQCILASTVWFIPCVYASTRNGKCLSKHCSHQIASVNYRMIHNSFKVVLSFFDTFYGPFEVYLICCCLHSASIGNWHCNDRLNVWRRPQLSDITVVHMQSTEQRIAIYRTIYLDLSILGGCQF